MAPHKSYTAALLAAVEKAESVGNRTAARHYGVDEKCVRRWRLEKQDLREMPKTKRARRDGAIPFPNLENNLEKWVTEQREKGVPVSTVKIRLQAKLMAQQMGLDNSKGGPAWCYRFMRRKRLRVRCRTTAGQKLPDDWEKTKVTFWNSRIRKLREKN